MKAASCIAALLAVAQTGAVPGAPAWTNSGSPADAYDTSKDYWSWRQAELAPACFVYPESTADVSATIKLLAALSAPFTVKSGGHTPFGGGSSIEGGVTIDLARLNQVTVSDDRQTVSAGPGNRWINVSTALDPLGLGVVGGRIGTVGVSGLILGGGVSFFSNRRGWACDNVRAFEVVLASGDVVVATPTEHSDLFWALRGGGGSHFGVVTRFDLEAFSQGDLWSRLTFHPLADPVATQLLDGFTELGKDGVTEDLDWHSYLLVANAPRVGGEVIATYMFHANAPADANEVPAVFADLASVPGAFQTTTDNANISTRLMETSEPNGFRHTLHSAAFRLAEGTSKLIREVIVAEFRAHTARALAAAAALGLGADELPTQAVSFHPITTATLRQMEKNGGNTLGLRAADGPLIHMNTFMSWSSRELDGVIEDSLTQLVSRIDEAAAARGLASSYRYMNYAGKEQDVYGGYGADNHERLRAVANRYDPQGVLKTIWRGYFEL